MPTRISNDGLLILILLLTFLPTQILAADHSSKPLSFYVLSDVPEHATIEQVCCSSLRKFPNQVVSSIRSNLNGDPVWLKIEPSELGDFIQVSPILDEISLFAPSDGGRTWRKIQTGDTIAPDERASPMPFMVMPVPKNLGEQALYIRVKQIGIPLVIKVETLSLSALISMQSSDLAIKMTLLGFIGAMIIYNIFVSFIVRDKVFALNALTILSLLLVAIYLSGFGAAYVWPGLYSWSNIFLLAGITGGVNFGSLFIWVFIKQKNERFLAGWPFLIAPILANIGFLSLLIVPYKFVQPWIMFVALLTFLVALPIIIGRARRGHLEATILLWPMAFAMAPGIILLALEKYVGVNFVNTGNSSMEITLALEAVFFSLALASRIRIAEEKHTQASEKLLVLRSRTAAQIISAQDTERKRLSKELHDGVGQNLLVILGNLKQIAKGKMPPKWQKEISDQAQIATTVLNDLRRVSRDMYPMTLEHLGLEKSIIGLLEAVEEASGISTSLECTYLEGTLSPDIQLHLYRIVQECLANIMRHSQARDCQISLMQSSDEISLTVQDNGQGMVEINQNSELSTGLGLTSIDDRARAIGATCIRKNVKSGGLCVEIVLRYPPPNGKKSQENDDG